MKDMKFNYCATYNVDTDCLLTYIDEFAEDYGYNDLQDVLEKKAYGTLKVLIESYLNEDEDFEYNEDLEPHYNEIAYGIFIKIMEMSY